MINTTCITEPQYTMIHMYVTTLLEIIKDNVSITVSVLLGRIQRLFQTIKQITTYFSTLN